MFNILQSSMEFHQNQLAFHINISYYLNQSNQNLKANKIYIKDYLKYRYHKNLSNRFFLYQQKIYKLIILSTDELIHKLLYMIKLEGYFNRIKTFHIYDNNSQYLLIDLYLNPIIKSVYIIKYKKLIIPYSFIWKIFLEHLGQPKNYSLINKAIQIITLWYQSKGFIWVEVKMINQHIINCISIKINEGLIKKTKFICESPYRINNKLINQMNLLIQQELKVSLGNILNAYSLEKGIKILKKRNYISNCYYKIVNYNDGVYILLKYSISDNQIIQYSNNSLKKSSYSLLLKQLYIYGYYYINFYYSKYLHMLASLPNLSGYTKYVNLLYNKKSQKIFTDIRINIHKLHIKTNIYKDHNYQYNSFLKRLNFTNRYQVLYSIIFRLEPSNISFVTTYLINRLCLYYHLFKNASYNLITVSHNKDYIILSKTKILYMNLSSLQFYFKVTKSYIMKFFQGYHDLAIYAKLYISLFEGISNKFCNFICLNQFLCMHYKNKMYLDSMVSYLKKHFLNISVNTSLLLGENKNSYLFSFNFNQANNIYLTFINTSHFEYNLSLTKYTWLYCFVNLIIYKSINYNIIHKFSPIYSKIDSCLMYLDNYLGLGIQLDSFIKEIPPIRIELVFDNKGYKMIHLYINYEYNNY
uniref:Uncharacterized protein n=2 Tax=Gelidium TaxID=2811 RepID=A0A411FSV7_9FLOR|nr:hypothetical protein [Gelidium coulteri]YP_009565230.1 hypothetical protein [Gelidium sinicola]QBA96181.1 hypothetical protein [Gelidium coulteri]QBA96581.1 hypothetical protein [Gelidium sinicola]